MEVKILVKRVFKCEKYTIGHLYLDGVYICDTLEDKVRNLTKEKKVFGQTAIPAGTYNAKVFFWNKIKRNVLLLEKVPFFSGILIHGGVDETYSFGCILVGYNKIKGKLLDSKKALDAIMNYITIKKPEKITITVEN